MQADSLPTELQGKLKDTGVGSGYPLKWIPSPVDLPNPEIEPGSPALQADLRNLSPNSLESATVNMVSFSTYLGIVDIKNYKAFLKLNNT